MMFEWKTCGFYFTEGGGKLHHSLPKAGWISPHRQALRCVNAVGFWLKNHPAWTVHWMKWFMKVKTLWDSISSLVSKKKKKKTPVSEHHASSRGHRLLTRLFLSKKSCSCQSPRHPRSVFLPICKSKRQSCSEGSKPRPRSGGSRPCSGTAVLSCLPGTTDGSRVQCSSVYSLAFILLNEAIPIQKQRC